MEADLLRFIGAGLAHTSRHICGRPAVAGIDGLSVARHLAAKSQAEFMALSVAAVNRIYRGWRSICVPDGVAIDHMRCLPAILADYSGDPEAWADLLSHKTGNQHSSSPADTLAGEITATLLEAARAGDTLQRTGLLLPVSVVLLEGLFTALFEDLAAVRTMAARIEELDTPRADAPQAASKTAEFTGELIAFLSKLEASAGTPNARGAITAVLGKLRNRNDASLTDLLDEAWTAVFAKNPAGVPDSEACQYYLLKAQLFEMAGDWQQASGVLEMARRHTLDASREAGHITLRRIHALTALGDTAATSKPYQDAIQICAAAIAATREYETPSEWAQLHMMAGSLIMKIAARDQRPDKYSTAAIHFKPAISTLSRIGAREAWGQAQLGLAQALEGLGKVQGDPALLSDAIFSYRAALGTLTADQDFLSWAAAKAGLGTSIVARAAETGDGQNLLEGISSLRAAREATADPCRKAALDAALGHAFMLYAEETDDGVWLREGTLVLGRALQSGEASFSTIERAKLKRVLATALWTIGETDGDRKLLEEAEAFLVEARNEYFSAGEAESARDISKQLARYGDVVSAMRQPLRHRTRETETTGAVILQFTAG